MKRPDTIPIDPSIDYVFSDYGGLPRGYLTELSGPDGGGKTTLALTIAAAAQKLSLKVGWIDVEYSFNDDHAIDFGVDPKKIDFANYTPTAESQFGEIMRMAKAKYGLIVLDSVPGLMPSAAWDRVDEQLHDNEFGSLSGGQYGRVARFLAETLPPLTREISPMFGNTALLFINQIRANIVKGPFSRMAAKTKPPGGYTFYHMTSIRAEIRRIAWIKKGVTVVGFRAKLVCPNKNRFAAPQQEGEIDLIFSPKKLEDKKRGKKAEIKVEETKGDE